MSQLGFSGVTHAFSDRAAASYATVRRTEPRIAHYIWAALGDARTILNIGAGTGSYEPGDRTVVGVEPSAAMRKRRLRSAAPCVDAVAEHLPFDDRQFDAAMAVLSDHHWVDRMAGTREMLRVARRVVILTWDAACLPHFWLIADYLPELMQIADERPSLLEHAAAIGATVETVPIPRDCRDGFLHAHWARPEAYLHAEVRAASSLWARVGANVERRALRALAEDLVSGVWADRYGALREQSEVDLGARLLVVNR